MIKKTEKKVAGRKKETFMQGIVTLIFSQLLIKLLGLVYNLYLTNRQGFGDRGNGIVSASYQIYAVLLTISSTGVPNAISKLVSERVAIGDHKGAYRIFKIAFATFAVIGLIGSLMLFFGANIIANQWLQIPDAEMTMVALSPAVFFVAIASVMRGYFNGRQNLKVTARSQTLEQIFKTTLTIILVEIVAIISNTSTVWMAGGATLATTLATFVGFGYLYLFYKTRRKEIASEIRETVNYKYERVREVVKKILLVSIPIALTAILSSLNKNIDSFTVVRSLKQFMSEDMAVSFATALVPAISAAKAVKDYKSIKQKSVFTLLMSMLIGLPCTIGMYLFAGPILNLLYPNASSGTLVLQISAFTIIFTILDQTINSILQGYGKLRVPAIALGCRSFGKINFEFSFGSYTCNRSKWSSYSFSSLSYGSIYNFYNCIK